MELLLITAIIFLGTLWGDNAATTDTLCTLPLIARSAKTAGYSALYVPNCSAQLPGGTPCIYPNGTRCPTTEPGYSNESTVKIGVCTNGLCTLPSISEGCWRSPLRETVPGNVFPVGCAFTCNKSREYGFYPNGTKCQHVLPNGSRVALTCRVWQNGTICRTKDEMADW
ncbi:uncharacterized protein LOC142578017 isoform X2 [Dermacentor variabilis]|uniref:uncharacterized protein LOC142578017 isoform X2 n=1 Tax=Dermacentor variabilis TaxID=34621 RepID=UPI003F5B2D58